MRFVEPQKPPLLEPRKFPDLGARKPSTRSPHAPRGQGMGKQKIPGPGAYELAKDCSACLAGLEGLAELTDHTCPKA